MPEPFYGEPLSMEFQPFGRHVNRKVKGHDYDLLQAYLRAALYRIHSNQYYQMIYLNNK